MATQQVMPVTCTNCRTQFTTPIHDIIDGQDLSLKSAFLQGRLNVAQCPQCGFTSMVSIPILYYDSEKELAFVLAPGGLHTTSAEQEKMIGNLTNSLINSLPAEQRKFYLFNPRQFLTLDNMIMAILEADGITPEVLEAQSARVKLIEEFLQIDDKATMKQKAEENDAKLDRQFFEILTASIQEAHMTGNEAGVQALLALRTVLARWSSQGRKAVAEIDAELGLILIKSQEELLEKLQAVKNSEEFEGLVATGYQLLDYGFFQKLTAQIDEATKANNTKEANALKELRTKILDSKERQEKKTQAALQKSAELLKEILQSGQPDKMLAQRLDEINETFFMVLSANIEEAQRQKQDQVVQAMAALGNLAMKLLQERQSQQKKAGQSPAAPQIHIAR
jgi:hypothetical protein